MIPQFPCSGSQQDVEEMLKKEGLDHWIEKIKEILELPNFKLLKYVTREEFDKVLNEAKTFEKRALLSVFERVVGPTSVDNSLESAICKLFSDEGLDDKVWVPKVNQTFKLDSIALLKNVKQEEFLKSIGLLTKSSVEQRALKQVYQEVLSHGGNEQKDDSKHVDSAPEGVSSPEKANDLNRIPDKVKPNRAAVKRKTWSAAEAFRSVQGGLLCKGIYLAGDVDELEKERDPVIDVMDNFEFKGSSLVSETSHREFTSREVTEDFKNSIDRNRSSKSGSGGLSFWGIGVDLGGLYKKKTKDSNTSEQGSNRENRYASSVHYQLVPARSLHLTKADVVLRPDVIQKLQEIEIDLKKLKYKSNGHFTEFFKKYGSHVNYGIIELGGVLMSTAECSGFKKENREKVAEMTKKVSDTSLKLGFRHSSIGLRVGAKFSGSTLHSHTSGNFKESELEQVTFILQKYGGPEDTDDRKEWRKGLLENSSLWRIINRNSTPKPIWKLLEKYVDKFDSPLLLANAMEEEWKREPWAKIRTTQNALDTLRRDILMWIELNKEERNTAECMKSLAKIRYKHDVMNEDWRDEVLYDPVIQEFITAAVEHMKQSQEPHERRQIITSLKNILHPQNKINILKFPNAKSIVDSITQPEDSSGVRPLDISAMVNLGSVLGDRISQTDWEKPGDHVSKLRKLQQRLEYTMQTWSKKPVKSYAFLTCIGVLRLFGFNLDGFQFDFYLAKDDLENVSSELDKYLQDGRLLGNEAQKQAFVMSVTLACPTQRYLGVRYVVENMPNGLCKQLGEAYSRALTDRGTLDIDQFRTAISHFLDYGFLGTDLEVIVRSFKTQFFFMKQPKITQQTPSNFHSTGNLDRSLERLLEDINLKDYYPQKLKYEDVITLTPHIYQDERAKPANLKELPWYFMRHIIGLNSNIRENSFVDAKNGHSKKDSDSDDDSDKDEGVGSDDDNSDDDEEFKEVQIGSDNNAIHPLDLIYAVFQCADDFLRQELADKMAKCQYAVPFILPPAQIKDESKHLMLHWALRSMTRSFCRNNNVQNSTIVEVETPLLSCLSFGDETSWKSKLLNKMLSQQQQTFWHQGLKGGDCKQNVSKEMVEVAWYLPGGRGDDTFSYPVTFANLRGNAKDYQSVNSRLLKSSSVTCVFTSEVNDAFNAFLEPMRTKLSNIIIIALHKKEDEKIFKRRCEEIRKEFKLTKQQMIRKIADDSNFDAVYEQMKASVEDFFATTRKENSVSKIVSDVKLEGDMKTDDKQSHYGRRAAKRILKDIDKCNRNKSGSAKAEILPCQSNIVARQAIAALEKELCRQRKRSEDTTVQYYTASVKEKKWQLQLHQLQNPVSDTFKHFLQCLITLGSEDRKYFLQALKMGLNERSVQLLEPLYEEYAKCRLEEESKEKEEKLKNLDQQLTHGSLGLEHFFREMAVMYDNVSALRERNKSKDLSDKLDILTSIMAQVLMEGTAIEIMDGDAVNVPVAWLYAVLEKVQNCKSSSIFKVSVLGAQSCGKSTLLNAVFGLNFPVSSGRCTRGAYMQLVKIDESLREILHCDYVAVIDSEGLMSRALSGRSDYDNELSTFIIGLSDLTLVIIKGEGNEMQDVLSLAIHVFLRMNVVGEHQACHFVHQNMGAVGVMTKVATEIDAFVRDLNEKTLTAAKDAGQADCYKRFTDVLQYDATKDNAYVPGLWDGSPPMGKTNIHYSATMQKLKREVMTGLEAMQNKDQKRKCLGTLEDFSKRLAELWDAIKYENFIFSFKNVLAVEAHKKLSKIFDDKQWEMKRQIRQMIKKESTVIENEVTGGESARSASELVEGTRASIRDFISAASEDIEKNILHYFQCVGCKNCDEDVRNRHLLSENEKEFQDDIKSLRRLLQKEMNSTLEKLEIKLKANSRLNQLSKDMDIRLKEKVQHAIQQQKSDALTEAEKENIFSELWKKETGDILREITLTDTSVNIEAMVQTVIRTLLGTEDHLYRRKEQRRSAALNWKFVVHNKHMQLRSESFIRKVKKITGFSNITDQDAKRLQELSDGIIQQSRKHYTVPRPSQVGREFTSKDAELLFKDVLDKIRQISDDRFDITDEYKTDLIVYIEVLAVDGFKKLDNRYRMENSPKALLDKKKKSYHDLFMIQMGHGDRAADFCDKVLKNMILTNIDDQLNSTELLHDLRVHCGKMFRDIKSMQASIMVNLFQKNHFDEYINYITQYETHVMNAMEDASTSYFLKDDRFKKLAEIRLKQIVDTIIEAVDNTVNSPCPDSLFIKTFFANVDSLKISHDDAAAFQELDVGDKNQFAAILNQQLSERVDKNVVTTINSWDVVTKLKERNLTNFLFKEVIGCSAKCPFCKVPCDTHSGGKSSGNHSATLHRPRGLGGRNYVDSLKLVTDDCCLAVTTDQAFRNKDTKGEWHPYKEYHKLYPNWTIHGSADPDVEKYWKWVFAQHNAEFAKYYTAKEAELPEAWSKYEREEIQKDIKDNYYIQVEL